MWAINVWEAKVNDKKITLTTALKNGDIVEILIDKKEKDHLKNGSVLHKHI